MESMGSSIDSSKGFEYYWLILKRRWFPASSSFIVIFTLLFVSTFFKKPTYVAEGILKFQRTSPTSSLTGVGRETSNLEPLVERGNPLATEAEVIRSTPIIQEALRRLDLKTEEGKNISQKDFLLKLKVSEIRGTDLLKVSCSDTNPKKAAAIVNVLMDVYLKNNIVSHRSQVVAARNFIIKELPKAGAAVSQAEEALRQFKEKHEVISLREESTAAVAVLTDLQRQIVAAQSQLVDVDAGVKVLQDKLSVNPSKAPTIVALSQSPGVQDALKNLQEAESQLAISRSRLTDENPKIVALKTRVSLLEQLLDVRTKEMLGDRETAPRGDLQAGPLQQDLTREIVMMEGRRQGLSRQLAALSQMQIAYRQRASALPSLEKEQRELERRLEATQATYSQLLQRIGEIQVVENQNVGNAQIIAAAQEPDTPKSSKRGSIIVALLMGILTAGATVFLLEKRDKSIKTIEQARDLFNFTLLGVIPFYDKSKKNTNDLFESESFLITESFREASFSPSSAAYRMLHANLKFLSSDKPLKIIVISSSVPQEGKSTISANLVAVMAQLGQRVLLIDADLHCPIQHRIWNLPNDIGLSNTLAEQLEPCQAIKTVSPNLDVLSSGIVPPNAIALLDSQRMAKLLEIFSSNYDYVIIDTPPLTLETDALILGKMSDGIVMVTRPEWVDVGSVMLAKGALTQSNQSILGLVVNGVVAANDPYSRYYFINQRYVQGGTSNLEVPAVITQNRWDRSRN